MNNLQIFKNEKFGERRMTMFYVKTNISNNVEIKVDLYDDEIYTQCAKCGKEMQVGAKVLKQILEDGDLASSSLYCKKCSKLNKQPRPDTSMKGEKRCQ